MKLSNKRFGEQDNEWSIPFEEADGILEEKDSGKVLSLRQTTSCDFGLFPSLQTKIKTRRGCEDASDAKIWMRSKADADNYFTLKNKANGQYLTQVKKSGKKKYRTAGKNGFIYSPYIV